MKRLTENQKKLIGMSFVCLAMLLPVIFFVCAVAYGETHGHHLTVTLINTNH